MNKIVKANAALLMALPLLVSFQAAADISREIRSSPDKTSKKNTGHLELGLGVESFEGPDIVGEKRRSLRVVGAVNAMYNWQGLFVEFFSESNRTSSYGYNLLESEQWSLDAIAGAMNRPLDDDVNADFVAIGERETDLMGGLRATGYLNDTVVQFELRGDISNTHNGFWASALAGRSWQWRNWNIHSMIGLEYNSADLSSYYYGVSPELANDQFSEFDAGAGFKFTSEVGVTYPVSTSWILRGTTRFTYLPDSMVNSPLIAGDDNQQLETILTLSYIF